MEDNNDVKYDLTGKKIIPLNAPIGFANDTPPTTLPFQKAERKQSVSEGLCAGQGVPYYNADGTVNVNAVATTLKMMLDMYNTISQPVALLSMGAIPEWSQSVRDNNNGYPKDFVVREYDTTGYFVYYQSLIDNNMNIKPTLASHVGWGIVTCYQNIFQPYVTNKVYKINESLNTDYDTYVIYMKYLGNNNAKLFGRYSFRPDSVGTSNITLRTPGFPNHYDNDIWGGAIQYSSVIIDESKNLALSIILNNSTLEISRSGNLSPSNYIMNTRFSLDVVFTD